VVSKRPIFARRMISDDGSGDVGHVGLQYGVAYGLESFVALCGGWRGKDRNRPDKSGPLSASVLVIGALDAFVRIEKFGKVSPVLSGLWSVPCGGEGECSGGAAHVAEIRAV
jgi:hypothetical protein